MKILHSLISLVFFLRKVSRLGLLIYISEKTFSKQLYFLSLIFAPIKTLFHFSGTSQYNLATNIEKLGPVFVKFGQTLSTRPDIIGEDIASSLRSLQDRLEPFDTVIAKKIIEKELRSTIESVFSEFDEQPIASATISQVYKAKLKNSEIVAVKVLRPTIILSYQRDISVLRSIAHLVKFCCTSFKHIKIIESVKIFEKTMKSEMDFRNEAAYCSAMRDNFMADTSVVIPHIYWDYTTSKILVLEWIDGISIYSKESLMSNGADLTDVLAKLAVAFFNQAFRDGFFHADLHPGNILITKHGQIAFIDFGIISFLSERDRLAMAEILYCLICRDYYRVAEIHRDIGFVPQDINLQEFSIVCRIAGEPMVNKSANAVSVGNLLDSLHKITNEFGMETQPQLLMLQKTILVLEGIGKILAPEVNMWHLAEPWIKKWASKNLGFDAKVTRVLREYLRAVIKKS